MNAAYIDDDYNDRNTEALDHIRNDFEDRKAAAVDHIRAARRTVSDCIDACTSMYDDLGPVGEAFKNFANQLLEAEGGLSRAEGELVDADPHSGS